MEKKRIISFILVFAMVISIVPRSIFTGKTTEAAVVDGVNDDWTISNPQGEEVTELVEKDGVTWRRFASGEGNDNGSKPGIFLNENTKDIKNGEFEFTYVSDIEGSKIRAGVYLRYNGLNQTIFVGFDSVGWFWQVYDGVSNPWYSGTRIPAPEAGQEVDVNITLNDDQMTVLVDGVNAFGGQVDVSSVSEPGYFGVKAASYVGYGEHSDFLLSGIYHPNLGQREYIDLSGIVTDGRDPLEGVRVEAGSLETITDADGRYSLEGLLAGNYSLVFSKAGYLSKQVDYIYDADNRVVDVEMQLLEDVEDETEYELLKNDHMEVRIDPDFPRVRDYKMLKEDGKVLEGQINKLSEILINDQLVTPEVSFTKESDTKASYLLSYDEENEDLPRFEIVIDITIEDNNLQMYFSQIKGLDEDPQDDGDIIRTIEIPNHSLVSVNSQEEDANFFGGRITNNTQRQDGDVSVELTGTTPVQKAGVTIGIISNNELSASIYTNSLTDKYNNWNNTVYDVVDNNGVKYLGLSSAEWIYQKGIEYRVENREDLNEIPYVNVTVTGDANDDGEINWNDGAVAYRDIMYVREGAELVPDTVAIRIAMNFGSHAQNPFLVTLDNVKKVSLNTDGLGQNILLKGYGSEGHDSGHLNYADIGNRIGGAEDMKILLDQGEEYGAIFGIHVNASETYPESKYFVPERLRKNADGSYNYGWNWIDQGININADYDLRHGRADRFNDLADALDRGDGTNGLDYVYVDVWGNGQSGDNGTWASGQIVKELRDNGWAVAGEWGHAFAYDGILQHWAADINYGGYTSKGINSKLVRFVQNHQRDSWVANHAAHSGAAMNPLLGGYNMKDFEGWQGRNNYDAYIKNLYRIDLPTKFVQHFEVTKWVDGEPTTLPGADGNISFIPEIKVVLDNEDLSKTIEIDRGANDYAQDPTGYRSRTMKLDGINFFEETPSHVKYLIPWYWDANGNDLASADQKLYHYNTVGGETTWTLPSEFAGLSNVYVYELTDTGKQNLKVVNVSNNQVTLNAEAETPYVLLKGEKANVDVDWSSHGHIVDTGFNSRNLDAWNLLGDDSAEVTGVVDTASGNPVLEISNNTETVSLSQTIRDLTPGQRYAVYVGVENRDDSKAFIELTDSNGDQIDYKYTNKSIALNFVKAYAHNTNNESYTIREANPTGYFNGTSYFQNMYVFFDAPEDGSEITLTIGKEAGQGTSYFDDIRVFENEMDNYQEGENIFTQDFEDQPQGLYPFVVSGSELVEDNRIHLSEKNAPYTQRGWHVKGVSDVIEGNWSLKTNGLVNKNTLLYQTIPQNYRFEPGKTYEVSFDYLAGSDGTYQFVIGNKPYYAIEDVGYVKNRFETAIDLKETVTNKEGEEANIMAVTFTVPQGEEDYWIGIFSTTTPANPRGLSGGNLTFSGGKHREQRRHAPG